MHNYTELTKQFYEFAKSLLIVQYHDSKQNQALMELFVDLIFANALFFQIQDKCLSVENSTGAPLDVVGQWVLADRFTHYQDVNQQYYAYPTYTQIQLDRYDDNQYGYATYKNYYALDGGMYAWNFIAAALGQIVSTDDDTFRRLIKLKIIQNCLTMTRGNIDNAIWSWSSHNIYTTWENMKLTYTCTNRKWNKALQIGFDKGYLPRPTAVELKIVLAN
jgi:hypothetical protein